MSHPIPATPGKSGRRYGVTASPATRAPIVRLRVTSPDGTHRPTLGDEFDAAWAEELGMALIQAAALARASVASRNERAS